MFPAERLAIPVEVVTENCKVHVKKIKEMKSRFNSKNIEKPVSMVFGITMVCV